MGCAPIVGLSGSLPQGCPVTYYGTLITELSEFIIVCRLKGTPHSESSTQCIDCQETPYLIIIDLYGLRYFIISIQKSLTRIVHTRSHTKRRANFVMSIALPYLGARRNLNGHSDFAVLTVSRYKRRNIKNADNPTTGLEKSVMVRVLL